MDAIDCFVNVFSGQAKTVASILTKNKYRRDLVGAAKARVSQLNKAKTAAKKE
jgi:hypothetical protein